MTYTTDIHAEQDLHTRTSRPGKPAINPTNPCFVAGQQANYWSRPRSECPYLEHGEAERHWLAGWDAEATAAHDRDRWTEQVAINRDCTGKHGW